MTARRAGDGTVTTHLDDRSDRGDGAEAERPGAGTVPGDPADGPAPDATLPGTSPAAASPAATAPTGTPAAGAPDGTDPDGWDRPPGAPLRTPMPTQGALSHLGDVLVSPLGRRRRETMVLLSLVVLGLLVWVAVSQLMVAPGSSQSILS